MIKVQVCQRQPHWQCGSDCNNTSTLYIFLKSRAKNYFYVNNPLNIFIYRGAIDNIMFPSKELQCSIHLI
jgi:hypothetical protein